MKKILLSIIGIVVGVGILGVVGAQAGYLHKKNTIGDEMTEYAKEKEYEILEMEVRYCMPLLYENGWMIDVVYKDDPNVEYSYEYEDDSIQLIGVSGNGKSEVNKEEIKKE